MLQQPSEFMMYRKLPLDLNRHTLDLNNYQQDFNDIGLRAASNQTIFFDPRGPSPTSNWTSHGTHNPVIQQNRQQQQPQHHHPQNIQQLHQQEQTQHQQHQPQQQQRPIFNPMVVPAASAMPVGFWQQQQARNCWFSNWQDLFQGILVAQEGPQKQYAELQPLEALQQQKKVGTAAVPSFLIAQEGKQKEAMDASFLKKKQELVLGAQKCPQVVISAAPLSISVAPVPISVSSSHPSCAQPKQSAADTASDVPKEAQPRPTGFDIAPSPRSPHSAAPMSCPGTQTSLVQHVKTEEGTVSGVDLNGSSPTGITRYTIKSPAWLPEGWITEVQTRRTGTTAGTRDKYYKDLLTGRRFRSRNEVLHFLETGKGRIRKRYRGKKALPAPPAVTVVPPTNALAYRTGGLLEAERPSTCCHPCQPIGFLVAPYVSKQAAVLALPPASEPQPMSISKEIESSSKPPNIYSPSTSNPPPPIMLGLKRSTQESPQKSPAKKKSKIMSPKEVDKQASRLWQWLQKPAAGGNDRQPPSQKPEVDKLLSQMADQRSPMADLGKGIEIAQRATQLGREMQEAQRTVVRLSREMRETAEKLHREIQSAQKNVDVRTQDMGLSRDLEAARKASDAIGSVMQATQTIDGVMGNIMQASERVDAAMRNILQASERLNTALQVIDSASNCETGQSITALSVVPVQNISQMSHTSPDGTASNQTKTVISALKQGQHSNMMPCFGADKSPAPFCNDTDMTMSHVYQATRIADIAAISRNIPQSALIPISAIHHVAQGALMPVVTVGNNIVHPIHAAGASQIPIGVIQAPVAVRSLFPKADGNGVLEAAHDDQRSRSTVTQKAQMDILKVETNIQTQRVQTTEKSMDANKQIIVEVKPRYRDNFSTLNPKLDLSTLSPNLTSRQRAKMVQRMKARYARDLLAILGRQLCYKALGKQTCSKDLGTSELCYKDLNRQLFDEDSDDV